MKLEHTYIRLMVVLVLVFVSQVQLHAQHQLHLKFINVVDDNMMAPGATYQNVFGETFTINNFKYYISNVLLKDDRDKWHRLPVNYYLVNEADSSSKDIQITHSLSHVTAIRFLLGVDSIKNVTGVQTGALDPLKGMFWTWNNGYIMAKLDGKSSASKSLGNYFTYHVGGYKKNESAARWIELSIDIPATTQTVLIKADAGKWFKGKNEIRISQQPVCHEPGTLAMQLADNYAEMFEVIKTTK